MATESRTRVSLTVPDSRVLDVMEILLTAQALLKQDGVDATLDVKHGAGVRRERVSGGMVNHDAAVPVQTVERASGPAHTPAIESPAVVPPVAPSKRNKVLYRVINPRIRVGQVPHEIRMCLLSRGPQTAKQLEDATGKGRKSVESALWGLRTSGSIESVPDTGQPIVQRRFDSRAIRMGEPVL